MRDQQPDYYAYLLRLWRADTETGPVWRASLDSPHTGERWGFADLAALFVFLEENTGGLARPVQDAGERMQPPDRQD